MKQISNNIQKSYKIGCKWYKYIIYTYIVIRREKREKKVFSGDGESGTHTHRLSLSLYLSFFFTQKNYQIPIFNFHFDNASDAESTAASLTSCSLRILGPKTKAGLPYFFTLFRG